MYLTITLYLIVVDKFLLYYVIKKQKINNK